MSNMIKILTCNDGNDYGGGDGDDDIPVNSHTLGGNPKPAD